VVASYSRLSRRNRPGATPSFPRARRLFHSTLVLAHESRPVGAQGPTLPRPVAVSHSPPGPCRGGCGYIRGELLRISARAVAAVPDRARRQHLQGRDTIPAVSFPTARRSIWLRSASTSAFTLRVLLGLRKFPSNELQEFPAGRPVMFRVPERALKASLAGGHRVTSVAGAVLLLSAPAPGPGRGVASPRGDSRGGC
jgi:hypothetical protein